MPLSQEQRALESRSLRQKAEEQAGHESEDVSQKSPEQIKALLHELHVHQIELEMQNENLRANQMELELARERFSDLYDFAPVGYLTLNQAGEILQANLTSTTMLGVERVTLLSQKFNRFVLSSDQDHFYKVLRTLFTKRERHVWELHLQPLGRQIFIGRLEGVWALEKEDSVCRMTLSDVTEQKRAEERYCKMEGNKARYESEEWKRLALEAGELSAWDQDLQNGKINCAGGICEMLGFEESKAVAWEQILERIYQEDRPAFLRDIEHSTVPGSSQRLDSVFRVVMNGELRWVRMVARTSFSSQNGRVKALRRTGVLADITQLKRAEETLRTHAEQLNAMVQERTLRLSEAVAELEHLSYTLVHDLRAPLRSVSGYTSLLLRECKELEPSHRTYLERSSAAAIRMDNLIVDTLSYSQISRQHTALERVDALTLLQQLLQTYPQFQEAAEFITVTHPWPTVMASTALLTQCFSNLLTNALKFVAPGQKPVVRIHAEEAGKRVRIWFEDQGIGIDDAGKKRLFGMFQRLQTNYEGTGIGLALVKKAVELMNGTVGVESEPGRGSRFWLELEKAGDPATQAAGHHKKS